MPQSGVRRKSADGGTRELSQGTEERRANFVLTLEEIANLAWNHSVKFQPAEKIRLRLLRILKQSRPRGHKLRERFTKLPELNETCVGIVRKVTLRKSPKTPQLRIVHGQEREIR